MDLESRLGLCATCRYRRDVPNRRGSVFYRCGRSDQDPAFAKYPNLPMIACRGHEPVCAPDSARRRDDVRD